MASITKRISTRVVVDTSSGRERTVTTERYRARYRDEAGKEHARHFVKKANAQRWLDEVTVPMSRITQLHVEAWMKAMTKPGLKRKKGLAASTRRTRYNYVRMAFLAAVKARVIRQDPTAGITPPRVAKSEGKMRIPTPEQVGAALREAPSGFHAFVAVCAFAGLRLGEAAGLQLGDVDFLRRTLSIQRQIQGQVNAKTVEVSPKYESARTVYLPDDLVTVLAAHLEKHPPMGEERWLFLRGKVGMEAFTLHDLRHFFASGLIADGCDVVTVQHALGHSSASITLNVYSHLWPKAEDRTRAAAATLMATAAGSADPVRTLATF
jgi:integrase